MSYTLPLPLQNTNLNTNPPASQVEQSYGYGADGVFRFNQSAAPQPSLTPVNAFASERMKLIDTIKIADPVGYQAIADATSTIDTDIGNAFMRDLVAEIADGVALQEAYSHVYNKIKDLQGNATDMGLMWGSTAAPFLTKQLSKVTGKSIAQFLVPQTDFEAALTFTGIGKGIQAGLKAGQSAARIAAGETAEEFGGGLAAYLGSNAAEQAGLGPIGQIAGGLAGGLGGSFAASRATVGRSSSFLPEPPKQKGMTRLYRGFGGDSSADNTEMPFYTSNRAKAERYLNRTPGSTKGGELAYVDVPTAEVKKYLASSNPSSYMPYGPSKDEYMLPAELHNQRKNLGRREDVIGNAIMGRGQDDIDPEVARLAFGDQESAIDIDFDSLKSGSYEKVAEDIYLTRRHLPQGDYAALRGDGTSLFETNNLDEMRSWLADQGVYSQSPSMRRALSGEDLGSAGRSREEMVKFAEDLAAKGQTVPLRQIGHALMKQGVAGDPTWAKVRWNPDTDELEKIKQYNNINQALDDNVVDFGQEFDYVDVNQASIRNSELSSLDPEGLEQFRQETIDTMTRWGRRLDEAREQGLTNQVKLLEESIDNGFTTLREIDEWTRFRTDPRYEGPLKQMRGDIPDLGGGPGAMRASQGVAYPRDIHQVMNEVKANPDSKMQAAWAKAGIDPSLRAITPVEKAQVAHARLEIENQSSTEAHLLASWDPVATNAPRGAVVKASSGRSIFPLDDKGHWKVKHVNGETETVPWQHVFERPQEYQLNAKQREAIFRFHEYINDVLTMRTNMGLPPIKKSELMKDVLYVPRQALEVRGEELARRSKYNLKRTYEDIRAAAKEGVLYANPRDTLEIFEHTVRREISNMQFEEAMRPFGPKPVEIIPQPVRVAKDKAHKKMLAVAAEARREAQATQTAMRKYATKDVRAANLAVHHARMKLKFIEGQLSGRAQLAGGRRQTPLSYGQRLADARGNLEGAKLALQDAKDMAKAVPRGKTGVKVLLSPARQQEIAEAASEFRKAREAYRREMEKVNATKSGGILSPAYFKPEVVATRKAWIEAEKEYNAAVAAAREAGDSIYQGAAADARKSMRTAEKAHQDELNKALKNSANERPVSVDEWHNRFYPVTEIDKMVKGAAKFTEQPEGIYDWMYRIGNIRRTVATGFDFGLGFIHLLPMMAKDPKAWAKAVWYNYGSFLDPSMSARYAQKEYETLQEMAQYEIPIGSAEFYAGIQRGGGINTQPLLDATIGEAASRKVRGVGRAVANQTLGRMAAGYEAGLLIARAEYWKAMKPYWQGDLPGLAQHIRNMTGGLDTRALGVGGKQRAFESMWVALSPRLMRSTFALAGDALQGFAKHGPMFYKDPKAWHATRALGQLASFATAMYILTGYAMGESHEDVVAGLNPLNGKKFLSHNVGGQWVGLGGMIRATSQMLAGLYSAVAPSEDLIGVNVGGNKPISDLIKFNSFDNPILSFFATRGAPATALTAAVGEAVTGANLTGFEEIDGAVDLFAHLGMDSLPFAVGGMIEGDNVLGSASSIGGLRSSPETPIETRLSLVEHELLPALRDSGQLPPGVESIEELGFGEADMVDRIIREQHPDVYDAWRSYRRQFGSVFQKAQDERAQVEAEYKPSFDKLYQDLLSGKLDERQVTTQLANLRSELRGRLAGIYDDPEYQKALKDGEANQMQQLATDYFEIIDKVTGGRKVLTNEDWDAVSEAQDAFMANLRRRDPELAFRLQKDLALRDSIVDAHPIIKLKREVDEASQEYYNVPTEMRDEYLKAHPELNVKRWIMYGSALQSLQAVDMALNKQSTGRAVEALRTPAFQKEIKLAGFDKRVDTNSEQWHRFKNVLEIYRKLPGSVKSVALDKIPALNAIILDWGGSSRLYTPEAAAVFNQLMSNSGWEGWPRYGGAITAYLALPTSNVDGNDQPHARALMPDLDAIVAIYLKQVYDIQPEFASEAGRNKYYEMTGEDTSKYAVIPPKEIEQDGNAT